MKKLIKVLEFVSVIVAIIISVVLARNIPVESILKGMEEPVSLSMTEGGLPEDYIGKPAGDDIPRIEDAKTWADTWPTSYVTIEPTGIIPTGVGSRHPWVSAYTNSSGRGGGRRRADVMNMMFDVFNEYGEYYILRLPDESYILAQMSIDDARRLEAGQKITLPVGRKSAVHRQALANIADLCEEYDVDTEGVFYCINDKWSEEHSFILQLVRIGMIFLMMIVIAMIFITIIDKVCKRRVDRRMS